MSFNIKTPFVIATHVKKFSATSSINNKSKAAGLGSVGGVLYFNNSSSVVPIQAASGSSAYEVVTAANILTAAESGKTFFLDAVAGFLTTLPAPALGLNFKFIVKTSPTSNGYTIGTPTANIIFGMSVERAGGAGVAASAEDLITLVANESIVGDWQYLYSDGTNWYVHGMVDVAAGVTYTVT